MKDSEKAKRILTIYSELIDGRIVQKSAEAHRFGVCGFLSPPTAFGELCKLIFLKSATSRSPAGRENHTNSRLKCMNRPPSLPSGSMIFIKSYIVISKGQAGSNLDDQPVCRICKRNGRLCSFPAPDLCGLKPHISQANPCASSRSIYHLLYIKAYDDDNKDGEPRYDVLGDASLAGRADCFRDEMTDN